jgi:site-specific DNA-adenine methylase
VEDICLKPFFCYYGGKWRVAKRYPAPVNDTIIEPFAGAAGYSTRYYNKNVILYDIDPVICGVWDYLINVSVEELMSLPSTISHIDDLNVCQEAKWLIGFWLNKGTTTPKKSPSLWMRQGLAPNSWWGDGLKTKLAKQIEKIKHWKIVNSTYESIPDIQATWFVDPPYQGDAGQKYKCKFSDFENLANWCKNRSGQVIVCEQEGANWLPFQPFHLIKSTPGSRGKSRSAEVIWQK